MSERGKNEKVLLCSALLSVLTAVSTVMVVHAKSEVAGGYDTGFARDTEEARTAIDQFENVRLLISKTIIVMAGKMGGRRR